MTGRFRHLVLPLLALLLSAASLAAEEPNPNVRFGLPRPAKAIGQVRVPAASRPLGVLRYWP